MHPLLVLSTLAVAEHFAGIQGLLLAVPVALYLIANFILYPAKGIVPNGGVIIGDSPGKVEFVG